MTNTPKQTRGGAEEEARSQQRHNNRSNHKSEYGMKKKIQKGGRGRDRWQKIAYTDGTIITNQETREVGNEEENK